DVDALAELLTDSAALAMPPTATWFRGRDVIAAFLRLTALDGNRTWRLEPTTANGQPAFGAYLLEPNGSYRPYGLTVLTLSTDGIAEIITFRDPSAPGRFGLPPRL